MASLVDVVILWQKGRCTSVTFTDDVPGPRSGSQEIEQEMSSSAVQDVLILFGARHACLRTAYVSVKKRYQEYSDSAT